LHERFFIGHWDGSNRSHAHDDGAASGIADDDSRSDMANGCSPGHAQLDSAHQLSTTTLTDPTPPSRAAKHAAAKSDAESNARDYESFGHDEENITSNMQGPAPNGSVRKVAAARQRAGNMGKALVSSAHLIVCKPDTACLMASCHGLEMSTESLSIVF
jgi:hypothetical protein